MRHLNIVVRHRNPAKKQMDASAKNLSVAKNDDEKSVAPSNENEIQLLAIGSSLFNRRNQQRKQNERSRSSQLGPKISASALKPLEDISQWLWNGNVGQLENMLLKGKAYLIEEREEVSEGIEESGKVIHPSAREFMDSMPEYKQKIDRLLEAICLGDERTVAETVQFKKCILARHPRTLTSTIHLAVIHNHPNVLQILLAHPTAPIHSRDMDGRTALHYAALVAGAVFGAESKCYDLLVDKNANEALTDFEGYTPNNFYRVPKLVDIHQVKGLNQYPLEHGDEVDGMIAERDVEGLKALILDGQFTSANIQGRIIPPLSSDLAGFMSNLNMRIGAVHEAVRDDDFPTLKQLLDSLEMAVGKDEFGRTPLHLAVLYGRERMVRYLLLLFPDCISILDKGDRSALHYATSLADDEKRKVMTRLLFRAGAGTARNSATNLLGQRRKSKCIRSPPRTFFQTTPSRYNQQEFHGQMERDGRLMDVKRKVALDRPGGHHHHPHHHHSPAYSPPLFANGFSALSSKEHRHKHRPNRSHRQPEIANKVSGSPAKYKTVLNTNKSATGKSAMLLQDDEEDEVDLEVEGRILAIDFNKKDYHELEQLQFEGRTEDIWNAVKKHLGNEKLCKYVYAYRQAQNRLNSAFSAVDENDLRKLKGLLDEELVQTRDSRVLKERHEIVEYVAYAFPKFVDIADHAGRSPAHYAAPQQNAIYDTLLEAGANIYLPDKNGFSASRYRNSPDQMVLPLPAPPSMVPLDSQAENTNLKQRMSIDDSLSSFDPGRKGFGRAR